MCPARLRSARSAPPRAPAHPIHSASGTTPHPPRSQAAQSATREAGIEPSANHRALRRPRRSRQPSIPRRNGTPANRNAFPKLQVRLITDLELSLEAIGQRRRDCSRGRHRLLRDGPRRARPHRARRRTRSAPQRSRQRLRRWPPGRCCRSSFERDRTGLETPRSGTEHPAPPQIFQLDRTARSRPHRRRRSLPTRFPSRSRSRRSRRRTRRSPSCTTPRTKSLLLADSLVERLNLRDSAFLLGKTGGMVECLEILRHPTRRRTQETRATRDNRPLCPSLPPKLPRVSRSNSSATRLRTESAGNLSMTAADPPPDEHARNSHWRRTRHLLHHHATDVLLAVLDNPALDETQLCLLLDRKDVPAKSSKRSANAKPLYETIASSARSRSIRTHRASSACASSAIFTYGLGATRSCRRGAAGTKAHRGRPTSRSSFAASVRTKNHARSPWPGQSRRRAPRRRAPANSHRRPRQRLAHRSANPEGALHAKLVSVNVTHAIAQHRRWSCVYNVRLALIRAPGTTLASILTYLPEITVSDLRDLCRTRHGLASPCANISKLKSTPHRRWGQLRTHDLAQPTAAISQFA